MSISSSILAKMPYLPLGPGLERVPRTFSLVGLAAGGAVKEQALKALDLDQDGAVSRGEFDKLGNKEGTNAASSAVFASLDADADDKLSFSEVAFSRLFSFDNLKVLLGLQEKADLGSWLLDRADADGDAALNLDEYAAVAPRPQAAHGADASADEIVRRNFERADSDQDGRLSNEEMRAQLQGAVEILSLSTGASRMGGAFMTLADKDGDGGLNAEEVTSAATAAGQAADGAADLLASVDADGDGRVTAEELEAKAAGRSSFYDRGLVRLDDLPPAGEMLLRRLLNETANQMTAQLVASVGRTSDRTA